MTMIQCHRVSPHVVLALAVLCLGAAAATASDHFPLEPGSHWEYIQNGAPEPHLFIDVTGPAEFRGAQVVAMDWTVSGHGESNTVTEYYSVDGGEVRLHGSRSSRVIDGALQEYVLTPPAVIQQVPLVGGASWTTEYTLAYYVDGALEFTKDYEYTMSVDPAVPLSTPAGELTACRVTWTSPVEGGEERWYAPGIGLVWWERDISPVVYMLHEQNLVVSSPGTSVGDLKSRFLRD